MSKIWKIEYKDQPRFTIDNNKVGEFEPGFYEIYFKGQVYGIIGLNAFNDMKTEKIVSLFETMLNDTYDLALKQRE